MASAVPVVARTRKLEPSDFSLEQKRHIGVPALGAVRPLKERTVGQASPSARDGPMAFLAAGSGPAATSGCGGVGAGANGSGHLQRPFGQCPPPKQKAKFPAGFGHAQGHLLREEALGHPVCF